MASDDRGTVSGRLGREQARLAPWRFADSPAVVDQHVRLVELIVDISSDLDLPATLQRIVTAAMELTGAKYGALGVRAADGTLGSFHHAGIDVGVVERCGHLPVGNGLLGVTLNRVGVMRLDDVTQHPAAVGFPMHHPAMRAFLGVPIVIRSKVFGSLYLADDRPGRRFSVSEETAARALAAAAATAIHNAQLFDRVSRAGRWVTASREIISAVLSAAESQSRSLELIAERACALADAEQAIVLVPSDTELLPENVEFLDVASVVGLHADEVIAQQIPVEASTCGDVFRSVEPIITDSFRHPIAGFTDVGPRSAVVMPLRAYDTVLGVIAVARNPAQPPFDDSYLELVNDFAGHAAIALRLAAQARERELSVLTDRERIAHDLHDRVIQQLFAIGIELQGSLARAPSGHLSDRLTRSVDMLQASIEEIRTAIFRLQKPNAPTTDFRRRIEDRVAALTHQRPIKAALRITGPMTIINAEQAEHAEAVIIETISNALRHADATHLVIDISVADELAIDITDDGCGIPPDNDRRSGLANMVHRAEKLGGSCEITTPSEGGTHLRWTAPLIGPFGAA